MDYTHIVVATSTDDKEYLYRTSDGMRIGGRQHAVVVYGTEPNKSASHVFIDSAAASRWLREQYAKEDLQSRTASTKSKVVLDVRNGDPTDIILPAGVSIDGEFMGGARTIRKVS